MCPVHPSEDISSIEIHPIAWHLTMKIHIIQLSQIF